MERKEYNPQDYFSGIAEPEQSPRVIISPQRYIQGVGVLDNIGRYVGALGMKKPAILITEGGMKRVGERILNSLKESGTEPVILLFNGECADQEIQLHVDQLKGERIDSLIAVGGGKCLDTGKCIAFCISVPAITCPTVASTDAPCSAVSVIYTPEGAFDRPWFFPENPILVLVDTGEIIRAPLRYLVSGIGDAMSTYYEARTCFLNPKARTMVGARPTAMVLAIAELGARLLFENGVKAIESIKKNEVNEAVENIIEANTLLSGIGFESGGLAASHGFAQVLPVIPFLHDKYMHGEMVAMGVLVHKCLEEDKDEARRIASFFARVGLPVHLGQLSLDLDKDAHEIKKIIDEAMNVFFMHYETFEVTHSKLTRAVMEANALGLEVSKSIGDDAYREIHSQSLLGG